MRFSLSFLLGATFFFACLLGLVFYDNSEIIWSKTFQTHAKIGLPKISHDGRLVYYCDREERVVIYDLKQHQEIANVQFEPNFISWLQLSTNHKVLRITHIFEIGTSTTNFKYIQLSTGETSERAEENFTYEEGPCLQSEDGEIISSVRGGEYIVYRKRHWSGIHSLWAGIMVALLIWVFGKSNRAKRNEPIT